LYKAANWIIYNYFVLVYFGLVGRRSVSVPVILLFCDNMFCVPDASNIPALAQKPSTSQPLQKQKHQITVNYNMSGNLWDGHER